MDTNPEFRVSRMVNEYNNQEGAYASDPEA